MKRCLIIGGGFAGCAAAHQFEGRSDWEVTLIESSGSLGAGVRTHWWGGHPYTFGPRHFLTKNEKVFDFLNKHLPLRLCAEHEFISYVESDQSFYNFPINTEDISLMPERESIQEQIHKIEILGPVKCNNLEEYWINSVGDILYSKFIDKYSKKMWQVASNKELDTFEWSPKGTPLKTGARAAWDTAISAYPFAEDGYNSYFDLSTRSATIILNTKIEQFDINQKRAKIFGKWEKYDLIISTISPDSLFDSCFGVLPFVGRDVHKIVLPIEFALPDNVYFVYYVNSEPFTRIVEYKKFTQHRSSSTLIGLEIPSQNGKHYPLPMKKWQSVADRYFELLPDGVYSIGRAGKYRYEVDIDDCIEQALEISEIL